MIELEHTLIMLLLLINLFRTRPGIHPFLRWLVVGVILLAFLAPSFPLALPWTLFAALFIPILLWQSAQRLGDAAWFGGRRDFAIWLILTLGIAAVIYLTGGLPIPSAMLFGLVTASFVWNILHQHKKETLLGQVGVFTLVFLLTGVEAAIEAPGQFILALFAGGGIGLLVGFVSVLIAGRIKPGLQRDWFSILQVYLAYAIGLALGISAVAAAVLSIAVYVAFGAKRGLWADGQISPKPFEHRAVFGLGVVALAFFGWQTHIALTFNVILEVALALVLTGIVFWVSRRFNQSAMDDQNNLQEILFRVGFLLISALLLWPKTMLLDPIPLAIAVGLASLTAISASLVLAPMIRVLSWLDEARAQAASVPVIPTYRVKDLMRNDFSLLSPDALVDEIPAVLSADRNGAIVVLSETGELAGILTEADLFVKEKKLPRTDVTYLALFDHPIQPNYLQQAYSSIRGKVSVGEIMSRPVVTLEADQPISRAVHLFVRHGYKVIPVVDPEGHVTGVLTRADLIYRFLAQDEG